MPEGGLVCKSLGYFPEVYDSPCTSNRKHDIKTTSSCLGWLPTLPDVARFLPLSVLAGPLHKPTLLRRDRDVLGVHQNPPAAPNGHAMECGMISRRLSSKRRAHSGMENKLLERR